MDAEYTKQLPAFMSDMYETPLKTGLVCVAMNLCIVVGLYGSPVRMLANVGFIMMAIGFLANLAYPAKLKEVNRDALHISTDTIGKFATSVQGALNTVARFVNELLLWKDNKTGMYATLALFFLMTFSWCISLMWLTILALELPFLVLAVGHVVGPKVKFSELREKTAVVSVLLQKVTDVYEKIPRASHVKD